MNAALKGDFSASYKNNSYTNSMLLGFEFAGVSFNLGRITTAVSIKDLKNIVQELAQFIRDVLIKELTNEVLKWLLATFNDGIEFVGEKLEEVGKALDVVFTKTLDQAAVLMKKVNYTALQTGEALQKGYHVAAKDVASALKNAGYVVSDIGEILQKLFKFGDRAAADLLKNIGYAINDIGVVLQKTYQLPAEAAAGKALSAMVSAGNYDLTQTAISRLLFKYVYDNLGRITQKTIPGNITIYTVYDPLNRPVLMQDANLRAHNKWNYIKYDSKGRAIGQGIYTDATYTTLSAMQAHVSALDYSTTYYEERTTNAITGYYSNSIFPTSGIDELAYAYYDDYDFNNDGIADQSYQTQSLTNEVGATTYAVRGMLTAIRSKTVGQGITTPIWLTKVTFYDDKGVPIQTQANNQLNAALNDIKTTVPDFTGKPERTKVVKVVPSGTTTALSTLTYDHADRIKAIDQSYNGASAIRIAGYEYNELGQMIDKKLHSTDAGITYLQSLDYRYNIQGRLLSINNSTLTNDGVKNDDSNDVFGMEILYEQADNSLGNTSYFNGDVSAVKWIAKDNNGTVGHERSYKYDYDDLNRLKNAIYADRAVGGSWGNAGGFDEKNIKYDQNGNILALQRNAIISGTGITAIDDLNYSYNGNQLDNVTDGTGGSYVALGFKNVTGSALAYVYDDNGNLTEDHKKGLTLTYNVLNRTDQITINTSTGRYITYTYDATAALIRKQTFDNNTLQKTTDYIDGFVYENGSLATFTIPEGRVRNNSGSLKPEYVITDNMGNARVSFDEQSGVAVVRQENSYYPFGLVMNGSSTATPSDPNKNLYNGGSEWQNDFADMPDYSQTFYRNYDAALGRWMGVDPKSDMTESMSNYHYARNNPLIYNDPLGDFSEEQIQWLANYAETKYGGKSSDDREGGEGDDIRGTSGPGVDHYMSWDGKTYDFTTTNGTNTDNWYMVGNPDADGVRRHWDLVRSQQVASPTETEDYVQPTWTGGYYVGYLGLSSDLRVTGREFLDGFLKSGFHPFTMDVNNGSFHTGLISLSSTGIEEVLKRRSVISTIIRDVPLSQISKIGGKFLGGLSVVVTFVSDAGRDQGVTGGTWVKAGIGVLQVAFPVFGLIYGVADIATGLITGETITDRVGDGIDNIK